MLNIENVKSWQLIQRENQDNLDGMAIDFGINRLSYRQLFSVWENNARMFTALGITRKNNSRVMMCMPNSVECINIIYGLDMTGAIPVFFPEFTFPIRKVVSMIRDQSITDIVISDFLYSTFFLKAKVLFREHGIRNIITVKSTDVNRDVPFPFCIGTSFMSFACRAFKYRQDYHSLLKKHRDGDICYDEAPDSAVSIILSTSGSTTGLGRQIPFSDYNRNAMARQLMTSDLGIVSRGLRIALMLSMVSPYVTISSLHSMLVAGGTIVGDPLYLFKVMLNKQWVESLIDSRPNVVLAINHFWKDFMKNKASHKADLSFLKYVVSGGSYSSPEDLQNLQDFLRSHNSNAYVINGYGASELGGCCMALTDKCQRFDSMGIPLPGVKTRIRDDGGNFIVPADEPLQGELYVCTETLSPDFPGEKATFKTEIIDGERYFKTKDIVKYHDDGSYDFVTRVDMMFQIVSGIKYYPLIVEGIIRRSAGDMVENCAIIGEPMGNGIHDIVLYVVLRHGISASIGTVNELFSRILITKSVSSDNRIEMYELPDKVIFAGNLPLNAGGKTDYHQLRDTPVPGVSFRIAKNVMTDTFIVIPTFPSRHGQGHGNR